VGRSFYLAASSERPAEVRIAMRDIEALGYSNAQDWTTALGAPMADYPRLADEDITAARDSDLFVFLAEPMSHGAMAELGARLGAGKRAHVLSQATTRHFFTYSPLCVIHRTWSSVVDAAARESRGAL
jgi:hypothetical protein